MKKLYQKVQPAGFIHTERQKFFLLRGWASVEDGMLVYPVAECGTGDWVADPDDPINKTLKGYDQVTLKVHPTHCAVVLGYYREPIMVFKGEFVQEDGKLSEKAFTEKLSEDFTQWWFEHVETDGDTDEN